MTQPVIWLPEAHAELKRALAQYDAIQPALATRFLLAVEETIEASWMLRLRFAVVDKDRRRAGVRRFPYGIFFLTEETRGWRIIRPRHLKFATARTPLLFIGAPELDRPPQGYRVPRAIELVYPALHRRGAAP